MKKKIALVQTSLLILTALLTTPYFTPTTTAPNGASHWMIVLATQNCSAKIVGNLTSGGAYISGSDFNLTCDVGEGFVFWKVNVSVTPTDIHFMRWINNVYNQTVSGNFRVKPPPDEPHVWYENVTRPPNAMVVVEVHDSELKHQWQLTMLTENCSSAVWSGTFSGIGFTIRGQGTQMQSKVVQTPNCTIPNSVSSSLTVNGTINVSPPPTGDITQFPWKFTWSQGNSAVELEITEVQMYCHVIMGGFTTGGGKLQGPWELYPDPNRPMSNWTFDSWKIGKGTPFATRAPYYTPLHAIWENLTFTHKDPITGIVKQSIPSDGYVGVKHTWWSSTAVKWFNMTIKLEQQACGWLFTGEGKNPILGCVDYYLYSNYSGVYTLGPDQTAKTADDELIAGKVSKTHPAYPSAGAGAPLGPCLKDLSGPDGIPGTCDDPFGRGDPDGPDEPGSCIFYVPATLDCDFNDPMAPGWHNLYESPWPIFGTTGTAYNIVIQPGAFIDGYSDTLEGSPMEFIAGLDHPGWKVNWKHPKCNVYVNYSCVWSVLNVTTALGPLEIIYEGIETRVREDCLIISKVPEVWFCDLDGDEEITIFDVSIPAKAYEQKDEGWQYPTADKAFNAMGDLVPPTGYVDIFDVGIVAKGYEWKLTPQCFQPPPGG